MEEKKESPDMLDLLIRPGFYVADNKILRLNAAAQGLLLSPGDDIRPLILAGAEDYEAFQGGCLYLRLALSASGVGACVTKSGDVDVFVLEAESADSALQALSLAARELREPLAAVMISSSALQSRTDDPESAAQAAHLNRGLHQLLRLVGNMSDAGRIPGLAQQETTDLSELFFEIFEKAATLAQSVGVTITYRGPEKSVICLADRDLLERAVLNLISNALKFTPAGGTISANLVCTGKRIRLSISDSGSGVAENLMGSLFSRYLRQPCIEDGRYGLGLGMVLVRSAAAAHGGAVLIDQPEGCGTRVTLTLALRKNPPGMLRSPVMRVDYTGERDHALVELSDCLPAELYGKD